MRILSAIAVGVLAVAASAQTNTVSVAPVGGTGLTWNGASGAANFVDLDVTDAAGITLQALALPVQNPAGTAGNVEVWITPTTHIGQEQTQANWTQIATGALISGGFAVLNTVCLNPTSPGSTFLATGQYGLAVVFLDNRAQFFGVTTYPTGPYTGPGLSVDNGAAQPTAWTTAPLANFVFNGINHVGCVPELDILYASGPVAHACATTAVVGEGSNRSTASAFDLFDEPNASADASAALQGNSLSFIPNGGLGYIMIPGTATYVAPTASANVLAPADDQEYPIQVIVPLQYPTETGVMLTNDLFINTNGHFSFVQSPGNIANSPLDPQGSMQADADTYFIHHDFDATEAGSGNISWEEDLVNGKTYITWENVEADPAGTVNASTVQFQIDQATGQIDMVFELIDPTGGSTIIGGDNWMIGWSPSGASPRVDEFDYTQLVSETLTLPEVQPFSLEAVGLPLIGQSFDLVTTNDPTPSFGVNLLATSVLPAPFDLSAFGAPAGTGTYLDPNVSILNTIGNLPGSSLTLTLPVANVPALAGLEIYSQSFWLDFGATPFPFGNLIASNMVTAVVGNF